MSRKKSVSNKLEQSLFEYICLIQVVCFIYLMIQGVYRVGWNYIVLVDLVIILFSGSFFYLSRFRGLFEKLRYWLILFLFVILGFFWYHLNGMFGVAGVGGISAGLIMISITRSGHNQKLLYGTIIYFIFLVFMQFATDWMPVRPQFNLIPVNYLIFTCATFAVFYYIKAEYDRERLKSARQNRRLKLLNQQLRLTIMEKEAYIEQLDKTKDQLIESEKMASVGRLTAGLAHELNNPLNFVGGNIRPVWNDLEDLKVSIGPELTEKNKHIFDEIQDLLSNIQEGSTRATGIIDNLLKISPRSSTQLESHINLEDLIRRTVNLFRNIYDWVEFEVDMRSAVYFVGNPVEINQVLLNLIKNAVDATESTPQPKVEVILERKLNFALLQIKDNGHGIKQENISKVFEPFFTTKEVGGTGLGLYISYGIIKKHGGEIEIISQDSGVIFEITLPLHPKLFEE